MISRADQTTIKMIAERAAEAFLELGAIRPREVGFFKSVTVLELGMVHDRVVPLRLDDMLKAERNIDLVHDVVGIHRHLDYGMKEGTARLRDCFLPRFARSQ